MRVNISFNIVPKPGTTVWNQKDGFVRVIEIDEFQKTAVVEREDGTLIHHRFSNLWFNFE